MSNFIKYIREKFPSKKYYLLTQYKNTGFFLKRKIHHCIQDKICSRNMQLPDFDENENLILLSIASAILDIHTQILSDNAAYHPKNIFSYINTSQKTNASSSLIFKNTYLISTNIGAVYEIYKLALFLLSKKAFMPKVGQPSLGKSNLFSATKFNDVPECPVRLEYAGNITILAAIILFFHELAHVLRNHLAYFSQKTNLSAIDESHTTTIEPSIRRAVECDADYHAGYFIGLTYKNENDLFKGIFKINDDVDFFKVCTASAKILFHSFEKENTHKSQNYHLPKTRLEVFLEGLTANLHLHEVALENAAGVVFGIERAFEKFALNLGTPQELVEQDGRIFYDTTVSIWSNIEKTIINSEL
jgi:hypothetical protein